MLNRRSNLTDPVSVQSTSDVAVWAKFGRGFRLLLRGGHLGLPPDLFWRGSINVSALLSAYGGVLFFAIVLIVSAVASIPISCLAYRLKSPSKPQSMRSKRIWMCVFKSTLLAAAFCVSVSFIASIRANLGLSQGIDAVLFSADKIISSTQNASIQIPIQMNAQALQYSQIISRTLFSSRVDLDVTRLESQIRENVRALVYSLGPYNIAFATITTNGPKMDLLIAGLEGKIESLRTSLASINQKLRIVNGVQNINGTASFQLSEPVLDTTSTADAQTNDLYESLSACSSNGVNFTALVQNSDLYSESNLFISSGFLLSNWTDIQSTIHAKLARNAAQVSSDVTTILEESMMRVSNISDMTSASLNETAAAFRTSVDSIGFMGLKGSDRTRSLLLNLFWPIYASVTLALVISSFMKWVVAMK
ncbi:hypothetical protein HDU78_006459 [Chytriomyces hyalinus]|nr:hypothetical protein HDU78_006459 [Chytriomyces hyalinus]